MAVLAQLASLWLAAAPTDDLLAMGRVATLAPLCRLRDPAWATDLRRAELQGETMTPGASDDDLRRAPGRGRAEAALGYAEAEALEEFAAHKPEAACAALARSPELHDADETVRAFRTQRDGAPGS